MIQDSTEGFEKENDVVLQKKSMEVWKVSEFTEKVNELFKSKYNIEINVTLNTINNYFRQLESQDVHYLNRINSTKIYNHQDLEVAEFIINKRTKSLNNGIAWQIPQIIDALANSDIVRKKINANVETNNDDDSVSSEVLAAFKKEIDKMLKEIKDETLQNKLLLESYEEKEKSNASNSMLEILNKQREYRLEAIALWEQKDDKERFEGWIIKREKVSERDRFIEDYIIDKLTKGINDNGND